MWNCLIFFVGEYSSVWPEICRVLSQIRWRFLRGISGKNIFWENFSEILCKPKLSSTKTCEISPYFRPFLFSVRIALKNFTQVLPYAVCSEVRRHFHKRIKKRRYREKKSRTFCFRKTILFTLGLGHSTPYSLRVLVWNFYHTFVTVSIEFWLRFEDQNRPTRLAINFLLISARAERRVRLCVKLFDFFLGEYSSVWPEIFHVLSQIRLIFLLGISGKNYFGRIFRKFVQTKDIFYQNLWNFALLSAIFILGPYCAEKFHTSTSICCLHPTKEARP